MFCLCIKKKSEHIYKWQKLALTFLWELVSLNFVSHYISNIEYFVELSGKYKIFIQSVIHHSFFLTH